MIGLKQFTIFFLLVVVFVVAISIVASLAWREQTTTYDVTAIGASLTRIIEYAGFKIGEQEAAMTGWVTNVTHDVANVETQIGIFQAQVDTTIGGHGVTTPDTPLVP
jgi:hypothetical protein